MTPSKEQSSVTSRGRKSRELTPGLWEVMRDVWRSMGDWRDPAHDGNIDGHMRGPAEWITIGQRK